MKLPADLREELAAQFGASSGFTAIGGGSISHAVRMEVAAGNVFVKYGGNATPSGLYASESRHLSQLRQANHTRELKIPEVLALADPPGGYGGCRWIALEWLDRSGSEPAQAENLGRSLALLHRSASTVWGARDDGFIGSLKQSNAPAADWPTFWIERRLRPQLVAAQRGAMKVGTVDQWDRLFSHADVALAAAEREGPSLLHGDLWSGNVMPLSGGISALIDPSGYWGHREVDLAMSELFGGFSSRFFSSYRETWPLQTGYEEVRRGLYQLYYLLVHVNLFGAGYAACTERTLRQVLSAL
ncbi:fructosamine kinase family protein [soil metagenome]